MSQHFRDHLELHFLIVLWGFTAVIGLLMEIAPVEVVFYRTLIAALALGWLLRVLKLPWQVDRVSLCWMFGVGFLFAAHWILFFLSARVSNASLCLVGMATTALWTSILEPFWGKGRFSWSDILLSVVAVLGIALVFNAEFDRSLGLWLAIISAFLAAVFTVINKDLVVKHQPFVIMFYEMVGAFLAVGVFLPFYATYISEKVDLVPGPRDWLLLVFLAVVCTVYAYSMSVKLMKRLSAFTVNLTINLEPIYGIILAVLILGESEKMNLGFYLGAFLILLSVFLHPILTRRLRKQSAIYG